MAAIGPIPRISMSLALLTLSLLLTGDLLFGERSDADQIRMETRSRIAESLAIQFSSLVAANDVATIRLSLNNLVQRDDDILSAALRTRNGNILAESGNHNDLWQDVPLDRSTLTNTQVPIFKNNQRWGTVQVRFADREEAGFWRSLFSPFVLFSSYIFLAGFVGYAFFMRRTLKHLDPSAVIPERVKAALDVLTEGVVLVDQQQQVVLANTAISTKLGVHSEDLLGKPLSSLSWSVPDSSTAEVIEHPWQLALADGESHVGARMRLSIHGYERTFMVNSSPILGDDGLAQGALATFDDVTELEDKNLELSEIVGQLQLSRDEVNRKNEELQLLAERDSLTNCLNRRAFFERADAEFNNSLATGNKLSMLMLDIDHFKSINDNYGHGVGDEVIKGLARVIQAGLRDNEVVGRYGGEEFCVLLPNTDIKVAARVAERLRCEIADVIAREVEQLTSPVTASIGVSCISGAVKNTSELVDQADQGLYASKESGRNRVTRWDQIPA